MNTPIIRLSDNLYLKMENLCETMSHKERLATAHINNAIILGYKNITVASCGNYGFSVIKLARKNQLNAKVFIPEPFKDNIRFTKKDYNDIKFLGLSYEESVKKSIEYAKNNTNYYDGNSFSINAECSYKAYYGLAEEIQQYFMNRIQDICLWIPVGNGITLTSIFRYFYNKHINIKYGIVGSSNNSSPILSMLNAKPTAIDFNNLTINKYNKPLVNYEIVENTKELIEISNDSFILEVSDKEIYTAWGKIKSKQPSGCAALAGFYKQNQELTQEYINIVLVTA